MASPFDDPLVKSSEPKVGMEEELGLGAPTKSPFIEGPFDRYEPLSANLPQEFKDLSEPDLYRGYKLFTDDFRAAKSDASELSAIQKTQKGHYDDYVDNTLKPFYAEFSSTLSAF